MRGFLLALLLLPPAAQALPASAAPAVSPGELVALLARSGPRPPGSPSHTAALALLRDAMVRAGLSEVTEVPAPGPPPVVSLTGVLPGASRDEIVLSAHLDTVPRSPGAGDDGSGCAAVLAAAADLARTPRQHTVRVFLADGEEVGDLGSRAWLAGLGPAGRDRILAALNVEMVGWPESAGPVALSFPARRGGERVLAPGWLVHAVLESGRAVDWEPAFVEARGSLLAQLVLRSTRPCFGADSDAFVARGVPALTLSDSSILHLDPAYHRPADVASRVDPRRLDRWATAVAAAVRRLDRLAGRPLPEDRYLVVFGRVWLRRDLYWAGFLLWALLVVRSGRAARRTRQRGIAAGSLPGLAFRFLFLAAVFVAPELSILLYPAALLAHAPPGGGRVLRATWIALGLAPTALLLAATTVAQLLGRTGGYTLGPGATLVTAGALAAWTALCVAAGSRPAEITASSPSP